MKKAPLFCAMAGIVFAAIPAFAASLETSSAREDSSFSFAGIWKMQSSCVDKATGQEISTAGFAAGKWHDAEIPGTVVGAQVADKMLPDPNYGMNLKTFPGVSLGGEEPFSNRDMPADSPYRCSHWFRMEFETPHNFTGKQAWLNFQGINYRANVWVNGKKIADSAEVAGALRAYEFQITELL